ncbi:hypothetical protein BDW68DRAFT_169812 [Aspergillus falconensis]
MSLLRRRKGWILVCANRRVAAEIQVISSDTDVLGSDVEWSAIPRLNEMIQADYIQSARRSQSMSQLYLRNVNVTCIFTDIVQE